MSSKEYTYRWNPQKDFLEKEWLKKQKIADLSFCFEFQVVVAEVGFCGIREEMRKWRIWEVETLSSHYLKETL